MGKYYSILISEENLRVTAEDRNRGFDVFTITATVNCLMNYHVE